jgi:flagellar biogenesis protein FliO
MGCVLGKHAGRKTSSSLKSRDSVVVTANEKILVYRVNKQIIKVKILPEVH